MQGYMYSAIAFLAMAVHPIAGFDTLPGPALADAWMPEMTGVELVSAIRADPAISKTPVYLFTAEVEMKDTFAAAGFDGMLLKPANLQSLRKLLK